MIQWSILANKENWPRLHFGHEFSDNSSLSSPWIDPPLNPINPLSCPVRQFGFGSHLWTPEAGAAGNLAARATRIPCRGSLYPKKSWCPVGYVSPWNCTLPWSPGPRSNIGHRILWGGPKREVPGLQRWIAGGHWSDLMKPPSWVWETISAEGATKKTTSSQAAKVWQRSERCGCSHSMNMGRVNWFWYTIQQCGWESIM